jgi:hypothetical protein
MTPPFIGLDFSGASDAADKAWLALATVEDDSLHIQACFPARDLTGRKRDALSMCHAVTGWLIQHPDAWVGCDFPFGLPVQLMQRLGYDTWQGWLNDFHRLYSSADAFRNHCRGMSDNREWPRLADSEQKTPFGAYNLRVYRQTYFGVGFVLHPHVMARRGVVPPMMPLPNEQALCLLEVCPASLLKRVDRYWIPYKGRSQMAQDNRIRLISHLSVMADFDIVLPDDLKETLIRNQGGDALDSVLCAINAFRAYKALKSGGVQSQQLDARTLLEGWVYI